MAFDFKKTLRSTAAVLAFTLAGAGAGGVFNQTMSSRTSQAKAPEQITAQVKYRTTFDALAQAQGELKDGNDEEAAMRLDRKKRAFVADALLDKNLSETDLTTLARDFNTLSAEDGIVFRTPKPEIMKQRDEALQDVAVTRDRLESALRLEDAMVAADKQEQRSQKNALGGGALAGAAVGLAYMIGRRRKSSDDTPKA
ncbi:MAG: hypothetical protein ACAH80_03980 [Alphaproteobacteria bacterium]